MHTLLTMNIISWDVTPCS